MFGCCFGIAPTGGCPADALSVHHHVEKGEGITPEAGLLHLHDNPLTCSVGQRMEASSGVKAATSSQQSFEQVTPDPRFQHLGAISLDMPAACRAKVLQQTEVQREAALPPATSLHPQGADSLHRGSSSQRASTSSQHSTCAHRVASSQMPSAPTLPPAARGDPVDPIAPHLPPAPSPDAQLTRVRSTMLLREGSMGQDSPLLSGAAESDGTRTELVVMHSVGLRKTIICEPVRLPPSGPRSAPHNSKFKPFHVMGPSVQSMSVNLSSDRSSILSHAGSLATAVC